ncbi:MAG: hypothetical protein HUU20_05760 [Pirellulales bacterium]|nr:hypothetical protein [Pirellulales bacterium]
MSDKKKMRKQLFVDAKVQGALVLRAVLYWGVCLITITLMLLCWRILTGPARMFYTHFDDMWFHYGPAAVASLLLLPLVIVDIVRLSNRFTGPLLRLRRSMRELARGEHVEPIHFRDGDFWQEFADEFNAVLARVQRPATAGPEPRREEELEVVGAWSRGEAAVEPWIAGSGSASP